jgi:ribosomal protein S11
MHRLTRPVVIGVTALALGGVGAGVALASPSETPAAVAAAGHHGKHPGEHGEFTGRGKAHRTIDYQRGTVTATNGTSITVRSKDGFTATYTVAPTTKVRRDKQAATPAQVQTGDRVFVAAAKEPTGLQVLRVRDRGPAPAATPAPAPSPGS